MGLFLSFFTCSGAVLATGYEDQFDAQFQAALSKHKVPGAAYAIIENGTITALKTYGVKAQGQTDPVTDRTVFRLASVSKTFTGELAAMLVADGALSWDMRVVDYVPAFRLRASGHAEQLKLSHILSHASGLLPNSYDVMLDDGWNLDKIIPRFKKLKPICKPGACYGYQNIVFSFVEPVIEQATGRPFNDLMQERIFTPLKMQDASIGLKPFLAHKNRASPHVLTKKGWYKTRVNGNYYAVAPAAGVNASITDLAIWLRAQMGYYGDIISPDLLAVVTDKRTRSKREIYRKVWRPHISDAYYGYGWRIYEMGGEEIILHAGGVAGFRSLIAYSRERDIGYAMLMNAETRSIDKLGADFWASIIAENPLPVGVVAGR